MPSNKLNKNDMSSTHAKIYKLENDMSSYLNKNPSPSHMHTNINNLKKKNSKESNTAIT